MHPVSAVIRTASIWTGWAAPMAVAISPAQVVTPYTLAKIRFSGKNLSPKYVSNVIRKNAQNSTKPPVTLYALVKWPAVNVMPHTAQLLVVC